jgi:hypothetical protein
MPKYKFTVTRLSYVYETYTVEADSEEDALDIANNGGIDYDNDLVSRDFAEWAGDWSIEDKEVICPLYRMVKEHDTSC